MAWNSAETRNRHVTFSFYKKQHLSGVYVGFKSSAHHLLQFAHRCRRRRGSWSPWSPCLSGRERQNKTSGGKIYRQRWVKVSTAKTKVPSIRLKQTAARWRLIPLYIANNNKALWTKWWWWWRLTWALLPRCSRCHHCPGWRRPSWYLGGSSWRGHTSGRTSWGRSCLVLRTWWRQQELYSSSIKSYQQTIIEASLWRGEDILISRFACRSLL